MGHAVERDRRYCHEDYRRWPEGERWELIDGVAVDIGPAPRVRHQDVVSNFHIQLKTHPEQRCYTGIAPTDVVFDDHNVVQPDVFLVSDRTKVTPDNIRGAPDLIIEVVSPSTEVRDRREKKALYERFGVGAYVVAFPEREYIEYYRLEDGRFVGPAIFNWDEILHLTTPEISLPLWEIFDKPPPDQHDAGSAEAAT